MKKLFLDDVRDPVEPGWDIVRDYKGFVSYIEENGVPDVISFDHDLAFEHYPFAEESPSKDFPYDSYKEKTGYHCAQYLVKLDKYPQVAIIHSFNTVGVENIAFVLKGKCVIVIKKYPGIVKLAFSKP